MRERLRGRQSANPLCENWNSFFFQCAIMCIYSIWNNRNIQFTVAMPMVTAPKFKETKNTPGFGVGKAGVEGNDEGERILDRISDAISARLHPAAQVTVSVLTCAGAFKAVRGKQSPFSFSQFVWHSWEVDLSGEQWIYNNWTEELNRVLRPNISRHYYSIRDCFYVNQPFLDRIMFIAKCFRRWGF